MEGCCLEDLCFIPVYLKAKRDRLCAHYISSNYNVHHTSKDDYIICIRQMCRSIIAVDIKVRDHFNGFAHLTIDCNIKKPCLTPAVSSDLDMGSVVKGANDPYQLSGHPQTL